MPRPIDADKLIPIFEEMIRSGDYCKDCIKDAISEVEQAPTLSPDDVGGLGKWVKNHDDVCWWWECSCCKEKPLISRFGDAEVLSAYCPRCGVKLGIPEGE